MEGPPPPPSDQLTLLLLLVQVSIILYDVDFVHGAVIGELASGSVGRHCNFFQLLCYNSHISYVSNINTLFKADRCPSCHQFINKVGELDRHLITCNERVNHIFPENVYQLFETPFGKLDSFGNFYTDNQKLFNNMALFDFESICVEIETFKDFGKTTWIGKHILFCVSISSNLT